MLHSKGVVLALFLAGLLTPLGWPKDAATRNAAPIELATSAQPATPPDVRLFIAAPRGLVIVDVWMKIGNRPLRNVRETLLNKLMADPSIRDYGRSTWADVAANPKFGHAGACLGSKLVEGNRLVSETFADRFDANGNGLVDRPEAEHLRQELCALKLSNESSHVISETDSPDLFPWLDVDGDGTLSPGELARAIERLKVLDRDFNDLVEPVEFAPVPRTFEDPFGESLSGGCYERVAYCTTVLGGVGNNTVDLASLESLLATAYSSTRRTLPESIDLNRNSKIDRNELWAVRQASSHLELALRFPASGGRPAEFVVRRVDAKLAPFVRKRPDRLELSLPGFAVTIDSACAGLDIQEFPGSCQAWLATGDSSMPAFSVLDANLDNRLSLREMRAAPHRLREFDANADGVIQAAEIPATTAVTIGLGHWRQGSDCGARDWFASMDRNLDGDLSRREFLGTRARFDRLDADSDGLLSRREAIRNTESQ